MTDLPTLKCTRCEHNWHPRQEQEPKFCPKCNSPYWNRERTQKFTEEKHV